MKRFAKLLAMLVVISMLAVLSVVPASAGTPEDDGAGKASDDGSVPAQSDPQPLGVGSIVSYAAWNDDDDRNEGYVYIYPLQSDTNIELWATTSNIIPIQIDTLVASWAMAPAGQPLSFGPLTEQQYFFKLKTDKPVTWELSTFDYTGIGDSSRFVIASSLNYLGSLFYFHADQASDEEVNVVNPGPSGSGAVQLDRWDGTSWVSVASLSNIAADNYGEFVVPQRAFYRVTSENPVLVYEGRYWNQVMATGVTPEGDTVGNKVYAANLFLQTGGVSTGNTTLHIMGVTAASYTVSQRTPTTPWSVVTTGSVAEGGLTSEFYLPMNVLFKVETSAPDEKVFIQYMVSWNQDGARGGAEMIPGIDGGDTTNPGTQFLVQFGGAPASSTAYTYQGYIDIIARQAGTTVTITGPLSATFTTTVNDEGIHFGPPATGPPGHHSGYHGLYTITSTNPVWVVVNSILGDQQSYFVYGLVEEIALIPVEIDIKPEGDPNSINLGDQGLLPVAVLGSPTFDVYTIDLFKPITLGGTGVTSRGSAKAPKLAVSYEDVNGDGLMDLVAFFSVQDLVASGALHETTTELMLEAETTGGVPIWGIDSVRVVPPE